MTAQDVIDQIKALPPEEKLKVIDFLDEVRSGQKVPRADDQTFAEAAKWVFTEHAELMRKLSQ